MWAFCHIWLLAHRDELLLNLEEVTLENQQAVFRSIRCLTVQSKDIPKIIFVLRALKNKERNRLDYFFHP